jgi:hypothetical protein
MSDDEYHRLLKQFVQKVRNVINIKQSLERLVQAGRKTGLTDLQIGDDIRRELKGELPDVTIRKYLPSTMKHEEKTNKRYAINYRISKQEDSNNKEINLPDIPPPRQEIKEVHLEGHPYQYVKEFVGSNDPDYELILDCKKFRTELRMGTLNNSKLKLKVKDNEVIKVE